MSIEVAQLDRTDRAPAASVANDLLTWAYAARQAHQIATSLAETSFVPKSMFRKPDEVTGAILAGQELGVQPMAALRSINIIDGTPSMSALVMRALLLRHGHDIWVEESTNTRAIVCGRRKGSTHTERVTWTLDDAKRAGLAGKRNWSAYPKDMLIARATAAIARLVAPDVLLAMPYALEEIEDGDLTSPAPESSTPEAKPRKVARKAKEPEPPMQTETPDDWPPVAGPDDQPATVAVYTDGTDDGSAHGHEPSEEQAIETLNTILGAVPIVDGDDELCTAKQRTLMVIRFKEKGFESRDDRLAFAAKIVGHPLASSTELTKREASMVIEALND